MKIRCKNEQGIYMYTTKQLRWCLHWILRLCTRNIMKDNVRTCYMSTNYNQCLKQYKLE